MRAAELGALTRRAIGIADQKRGHETFCRMYEFIREVALRGRKEGILEAQKAMMQSILLLSEE